MSYEHWDNEPYDVEKMLERLERMYLNGLADEETGEVEAPEGHCYRIGRFLVLTGRHGHQLLEDFITEDAAKAVFQVKDKSYSRWLKNLLSP